MECLKWYFSKYWKVQTMLVFAQPVTNNNISTCYLHLLVFQSLFQMWHKISRVLHIRGRAGKWMGGRWDKAVFQTQWTGCCAKGAINGLKTTLQGKAGHPIMVMDDWEQFHTNPTLLKSAKHCHSLIRALQCHEKAIRKSRPGYL